MKSFSSTHFPQIPAITYGGPPAPPDAPSPQSAKLSESLVILEFLADHFPAADLLPADPMQRARARFFARAYDDRVFPASFRDFFFFASPLAPLLDALATLQGLLPAEGFAAGEWSLADMAVGPFLARMWLFLEHDLGKGTVEDGRAALRELKGPRFARLRRYLDDVKAQPSFQATWDEVSACAVGGPQCGRKADDRSARLCSCRSGERIRT